MNHHLENKFIHQRQIEKNNMICRLPLNVVQNMGKYTIKRIITKLWRKYINHQIIVS